METNQLTVKEAIDSGYTYCGYAEQDEQMIINLSKLKESDFDRFYGKLVLADLNPSHFTISGNYIRDLVLDNISEQDEFADEDCELAELASEANFELLADEINKLMSVKNFYFLTDIRLMP